MMPLLTILELQPVLNSSKKFVGAGQKVEVVYGDVPLVMQLLERKEGAAAAKPRLNSSVDALKTLDQELDLPYSTGIDFDVHSFRTASLYFCAAMFFVLPAAGDERRFDRGEIQFASIYQWLHGPNELAREGAVSGGVPDFNQRL